MTKFPHIEKPFRWTPTIRKAVEIYAQGTTQMVAAEKAGMTKEHLSLCLSHPEVRAFHDQVVVSTGLALKSEMVKTLKEVATRKLEIALSDESDKDTLLNYTREIAKLLGLDEVQEEKKLIKIIVE